jgi:hypothetical protein
MGPTGQGTGTTPDTFLGNYTPTSGSPTRDYIPSTAGGNAGAYTLAPNLDFFGNPRKTNNAVDAGAVEFNGPAVPPNVTITPASFNYGTIRVPFFGIGPTHDFVLSNAAGAGPFTVSTISLAGGAYVQTAAGGGAINCNVGTVLNGGASCTIRVRFGSMVGGVYPGTITVTGTDAGGNGAPVTNSPVQLSGTIFQIVATWPGNPGTLTFTNNQVRTITVQNWGTAAVSLNSVTFTGTNAANFTRTGGTCGASLAGTFLPGFFPTSCTITVQFTAATTGTYNATFNLNDIDAVPPLTITLRGTR